MIKYCTFPFQITKIFLYESPIWVPKDSGWSKTCLAKMLFVLFFRWVTDLSWKLFPCHLNLGVIWHWQVLTQSTFQGQPTQHTKGIFINIVRRLRHTTAKVTLPNFASHFSNTISCEIWSIYCICDTHGEITSVMIIFIVRFMIFFFFFFFHRWHLLFAC